MGKSLVQRPQEKKSMKSDDDIKADYYEDLKNGKIDKVEDWENSYPMYFKKPSQLISIFNQLEQRNLGLILET